MARSRVSIPRGLLIDIPKMQRAINNALTGAAKGAKADFGVTTRTWTDRPTFAISTPELFVREIATDDAVYAMLDEGTRAHVIRPKSARGILRFQTPFQAKTVPNEIMSQRGSRGATPVVARVVHHPGTAARNWTKVIAEKWQKQLSTILQRAIDASIT